MEMIMCVPPILRFTLLLTAVTGVVHLRAAYADYPDRPIRYIVPSAAGNGAFTNRTGLLQAIDRRARRHRRDARTVVRDLRREQFGVLAGGEADDLEPIGMRVHDRQRALADGAGGSENGDADHRYFRTM